jgi:hypothetical protein
MGTGKIGNKTVPFYATSIGVMSAVIGGSMGYPQNLLSPSIGRMPNSGEAGFIFNGGNVNLFNVSDTANVSIANTNFTATEVGVNKYTPLLNSPGILWDRSFMEQTLGSTVFNETFGIVNFVLIKATSLTDVAGVVSRLNALLVNYPEYFVTYDQATIANLLSLQRGTAPLYNFLGVVSLGFTIIAVLGISHIAASRRGWEAGLLVSQGWSWSDVRKYFFDYFFILAAISLALSILASFVISKYAGSTYEVYGGYLTINVNIGMVYVAAAVVMVVILPLVASIFISRRLRRTGLDTILRDY